MITPEVNLLQDQNYVTIVLQMPNVRSQHIEIRVDGKDFQLYARPYHLRLEFPGSLVENEGMKTKYDLGSGELEIIIPKAEPGEHFEGLDLLQTSIIAGGSHDQRDECDLVGENNGESLEGLGGCDRSGKISNLHGSLGHGFNNQYEGTDRLIPEIADDVINRRSLSSSLSGDRRKSRFDEEESKFDREHYIADFLDYNLIKPLLDFRPETYRLLAKLQAARKDPGEQLRKAIASELQLTETEREAIAELGERSYVVKDERILLLGLLDILLAHCYDHRTTLGDRTAESAWTISKLSSLLSNFDTFTSLTDVLEAFLRRSLAFPLYRNYELSKKCIKDALVIFKLGSSAVLRALLSIKECLDGDKRTLAISSIYIHDYCIWIYTKRPCIYIQKVATELNNAEIGKHMVGWALECLEKEAVEMS